MARPENLTNVEDGKAAWAVITKDKDGDEIVLGFDGGIEATYYFNHVVGYTDRAQLVRWYGYKFESLEGEKVVQDNGRIAQVW